MHQIENSSSGGKISNNIKDKIFKNFSKPVYKETSLSTAFNQDIKTKLYAKGDWSPGLHTKSFVEDPNSKLN